MPQQEDPYGELARTFFTGHDAVAANEAFARLYHLLRPSVFNWQRRWCARVFAPGEAQSQGEGGPAWNTADELTEETFIKMYKGSFRFRSKLTTWVYAIAYSVFSDWLRRRGKEPSEIGRSLSEPTFKSNDDGEPLTIEDGLKSRGSGHDKFVLLEQFLERAIPDDKWREALYLKVLEGMVLKEVADALKCSVTTAFNYVKSAKNAVEKYLGRRIQWPDDKEARHGEERLSARAEKPVSADAS